MRLPLQLRDIAAPSPTGLVECYQCVVRGVVMNIPVVQFLGLLPMTKLSRGPYQAIADNIFVFRAHIRPVRLKEQTFRFRSVTGQQEVVTE